VLDQLKRDMGTHAFSAQYQQQPAPVGGGMIQWSWFKFYQGELQEPEETTIRWDTASKATELSDYSVGTVWGRFDDQYALLRNKPYSGRAVGGPTGTRQSTRREVVRMSAQTARIEEGRVFLPESAPWLEDFRSEVMAFPNGRHDDQVDSLAQALAWFTEEANFILRIIREKSF
jgi:phage terminase large subunit-like protein